MVVALTASSKPTEKLFQALVTEMNFSNICCVGGAGLGRRSRTYLFNSPVNLLAIYWTINQYVLETALQAAKSSSLSSCSYVACSPISGPGPNQKAAAIAQPPELTAPLYSLGSPSRSRLASGVVNAEQRLSMKVCHFLARLDRDKLHVVPHRFRKADTSVGNAWLRTMMAITKWYDMDWYGMKSSERKLEHGLKLYHQAMRESR